jgi:hypothetical protein
MMDRTKDSTYEASYLRRNESMNFFSDQSVLMCIKILKVKILSFKFK